MPIYKAITDLKALAPIRSLEIAQRFLEDLPVELQTKLISAIFLGREHLCCDKLREDVEISRSYIENIEPADYARNILQKGDDYNLYLDKIVACAEASGFDLNNL